MMTLRIRDLLTFSLALALLPAVSAAQDAAGDQPSIPSSEVPAEAPADETPTAEEVFEAYIEAIGGHEAIHAQTHRLLTGIYRGVPFKNGARISMWQQAPNVSHLRLAEPLGAHYDIYCDGLVVWERGADDVARELIGDDRTEMLEASDFFGESNYAERYEEIRFEGSGTVQGEEVWAIYARSFNGRERTLMFSKETKFFVAEQATIGGDQPQMVQVVLDQYEDVGGVLFPMRQRQEIMGTNRKIEIVYREGLTDVFEHDFSPPADMVKAEPAPEADDKPSDDGAEGG